jgi:hypothetical protein
MKAIKKRQKISNDEDQLEEKQVEETGEVTITTINQVF